MEEHLKSIFSNVNDWLKFAEAKNGVLVGLNGGAALAVLAGILLDGKGNNLSILAQLYFWSFVVCLTIGLLFSLYSFLAKVKTPKPSPGQTASFDNLLFFGELRDYQEKPYLDSLSKALGLEPQTEYSKLETDYANQIIANSKIAMGKYSLFNMALWCTLAGVATPIVALAVRAIVRTGKE